MPTSPSKRELEDRLDDALGELDDLRDRLDDLEAVLTGDEEEPEEEEDGAIER